MAPMAPPVPTPMRDTTENIFFKIGITRPKLVTRPEATWALFHKAIS